MSGRKEENFNDVEFVDGDKPVKAAEEEEEEAGEEDKLLIQHLKPTVHPSHKNYRTPAIEMRNPSDSSLNGESIEDVVNEHAELRDQHLNPDTVLLDMDNDSIPIDLTFFKIGTSLKTSSSSWSSSSLSLRHSTPSSSNRHHSNQSNKPINSHLIETP